MFIFDVDDTLYDLMSSFLRTHNELFADRTDTPCSAIFEASRYYNNEAFAMWNKGLISKQEEFDYRIRKSYAHYGVELSQEELDAFRVRYRAYQNEISMHPAIMALLDELKSQKIPMGVLTNGNHDDQWKKIKALDVERWIPEDHIFVSEDLPAPKPSKLAYDCVREALGEDASKLWYVGDTFSADIIGAQNGGWHSIWFNHRKKSLPDRCRNADYEVHTVEELRAVINQILEGR